MDLSCYFQICCVCFYLATVVDANGFYYSCYPNDTITVNNPLAYTWYRADSNDSTVCTVTPSSTNLVITGCSKDFPITLSMSNRTDTDYHIIHGQRVGATDDLFTTVLECSEISITGIYRDATVAVTPSIPQTFQQTVSPSFTLTSFIYTDSTKTVHAKTANSGDELYWNIVGPIEYDHKPEECIAYAGLVVTPTVSNKTIINNGSLLTVGGCTTKKVDARENIVHNATLIYREQPEECIAYSGLVVTPTVSNKTIVTNGCTLDSSLVSDWEFVNGTGNEVCSTIYAFRFFSSPYVTFECKVRVCPSGEADCAIDCSGRKRRDAEKPLSDDQDYNRVTSRIKIETPKTYELELKSLLSSESTSLESEVWWFLGVAIVLKAM